MPRGTARACVRDLYCSLSDPPPLHCVVPPRCNVHGAAHSVRSRPQRSGQLWTHPPPPYRHPGLLPPHRDTHQQWSVVSLFVILIKMFGFKCLLFGSDIFFTTVLHCLVCGMVPVGFGQRRWDNGTLFISPFIPFLLVELSLTTPPSLSPLHTSPSPLSSPSSPLSSSPLFHPFLFVSPHKGPVSMWKTRSETLRCTWLLSTAMPPSSRLWCPARQSSQSKASLHTCSVQTHPPTPLSCQLVHTHVRTCVSG